MQSGVKRVKFADKLAMQGLCGALQELEKGSIPLARSRSENEKAPSAMTGLFRFWLLGLDRKGLRWERWHFAVRQKRHLKGK